MRNLKLCCHTSVSLNHEIKTGCILSLDPVSRKKYIVDNKRILYTDESIGEDYGKTCTLNNWEDVDITCTQIIGAEIISSLNSVSVITIEGDVLTVNIEDQLVDVVGSVSDGITGCGWSPDQEILVLVTGKLSVILMTVEFEPFVEFSLEQEDFGESKFINIGWGKKETQFHGTEGKQAAKVSVTQSSALDWDDKRPKVTWRGDGQLFAISYVSSQNERKFRVVSREGAIQYTSANVEGLEDRLSWKPSGNLIAASQRLSNKHNVIFFEKNGLHHGSFTLRCKPKEMRIRELSWNEESTVLLVWLQPFETPDEHFIQLWTVGNYHWYLKQELCFSEELHDVKWDSEYPLMLHIVTNSGIHSYKFTHSIDNSVGLSSSDNAQVAVIDGNRLLVTPFKQAVVPPPMSAYEIIFPTQIHSVIFGPSCSEKSTGSFNNSNGIEDSGFLDVIDAQGVNSNNICVFHGKDTLTFLAQARQHEQLSDFGVEVNVTGVGGNGFHVKAQLHRVVSQSKLELPESLPFIPENIYNWVWVSKNTMVTSYRNGRQQFVIIFDIEGIGSDDCRVLARSKLDVEDEVITITSTSDGTLACLQLRTGDVLQLNIQDETILPWVENGIEIKFPSVCDQLYLCPVENGVVPLGLTTRRRLYLGSCQLLSNCTSIHVHNEHILITTTSHTLLVVPMTLEALKSLSGEVKDNYTEMGLRRLERGSRIVTAVSCDTKVLLQMPRGNLEVVNPRHLVIFKLKLLLSERQYHAAIDIMRRHRIDMNLLYDHSPKDFLDNIEEFAKSVDNPLWLDLFIASLSCTDVTRTYYKNNYPTSDVDAPPEQNSDKIVSVCEALRKAMQTVDEEKFLLPILSTYVKSSSSQMHLALMKLKDMKNTTDKVFKVSFEEGLRHLMYVADADELCDVALGTYDFELVMLVFEKSQKDPKEYLPFLNNLKQMEENYRKYKINVHLKRYRTALECIQHCDVKYTDEFLSLITKESLFGDALVILKKDSCLYYDVCNAYGEYLLKKGYYNEAAAKFDRGQQLDRALEAYEQSCNWKMAIIAASRLNDSKESHHRLYISLTSKLKEKNCYADAAVIHERYLQSEEDAVECYCEAKLWDDALLVASRYGRRDLVETNIMPGILDHYEILAKEIREMKDIFSQSFERLIYVRSTKREQFWDFLAGKEDQLDSDLFSDSSSVTGFTFQQSCSTKSTTGSNKTYRSSKNKRKLDRKKYSTKEGSNFEDLGLIVQLHDVISNACGLTTVVSNLNRCLLSYGEDSKAKLLQDELTALIADMQKNKFNIWINCAPVEDNDVEFGPQMTTESAVRQMRGHTETENHYFTQRMKELEPQYQFPPNLQKVSGWKLFSLDKLK